MEKGSPLWLETILRGWIEFFGRKLAATPAGPSLLERTWPWLLAPALIAGWFYFPKVGVPQWPDFGARPGILPLALGLALLTGAVRETAWPAGARRFLPLALFLLFFCWLSAGMWAPIEFRLARVIFEVLIPFGFFLIPCSPRWSGVKIAAGFSLLLILPLASGWFEVRAGFEGPRFVYIRYMVPVMLPLLAWLAAQPGPKTESWTNALAILLSPAQLLSKTALLPAFLTDAPGVQTRRKGLVLATVGLAHLGLLAVLFPEFVGTISPPPRSPAHFLWLGFLGYIRFYLFVYGLSGLTRGIFHLAGWATPPFFNFSWFAVTPQERWRRWDIPVYQTYRLFVFVPVFRRTNSLFLGILCTFMVVASSYTFAPLAGLFGSWAEFSRFGLAKIFGFYALQGLVVYLGVITQELWPKAESVRGWLGILLTTLLMSICYGLRHIPLA